MLFKFTAVTAVKCLNAPTKQLLNILSMPLLSHPCCNREEQSERHRFSQQSRPKTCFPLAKSHLLPAVHHPSAVLMQQFIINIIFRQFTSGIQARAQPPSLVAQARRVGRGAGMGCAAGSSDSRCWACCLPGCSAVTQGSLCAAWGPVHSMCAFPRSWVRSGFLGLFMAQHSLGNVLIQMFISQYVGVGFSAGKYKTCDTL